MNNTEKRLRKAGLGTEIDNGYINIESTASVCVGIYIDGFCHYASTDRLKNKVIKALDTEKNKWGGFKAAGGHWYLEKNYDPKPFGRVLADHTGAK